MATYYLRSPQAGQSTPGNGSYRGVWQASQTWAVGDRVVPTSTSYQHVHECTTGGAGTGTEPTWATVAGNTTVHGGATFTCRLATTWANANISMQRSAVGLSAGDVVYVRSDHSETFASTVTFGWTSGGISVVCVSDANEPPTTVATGAVVATSGINKLTLASTAGTVYFYGIRFKAGDGTNGADISFGGGSTHIFCENCAFELAGNNAGSDIDNTSAHYVRLLNCTFKAINSGSQIVVNGILEIQGGSVEGSSTFASPIFTYSFSDSYLSVRGFDFSNLGSTTTLVDGTLARCRSVFVDCKLPASWTGTVASGTVVASSAHTLMNCDSGDTNYRLERAAFAGNVYHETTLVRTGGASDGTTGLAWKLVSNASAKWREMSLDTPEIVRWNETTGGAITVTVEVLHDSATNLTDKEIWLEVMYLGTSGAPLGTLISDAQAGYIGAGTDQTTSSATWTTTGMSNPNKQKLSVTFTPQEKGFIHAVVKLAKASKTVYVDPMLTVS